MRTVQGPRAQLVTTTVAVTAIRTLILAAVLGVLSGALATGQKLLPLPRNAAAKLDLVCFPGSTTIQALRATWLPMKGTPQVDLAEVNDRHALKMTSPFQGTTLERASWDRSLRIDLARDRGLRVCLFCPDPEPVSSFSLYLRSGAGWYHAKLNGIQAGQWCTIVVDKRSTRIEGQPAGWSRIEGIRLSAWRGENRSAVFYLAGLGRIPQQARVAVVRGSSQVDREGMIQFAREMMGHLEAIGLPAAMLSDQDLTAKHLEGLSLLVLPYNPSLPEEGSRAIARFLEKGGKLLAFFRLPERLQMPLGITSGKFIRPAHPGHFASIHPVPGVLPGAPSVMEQRSWNIILAEPVKDRSRVAAWWHDTNGKPTGCAALVLSERGALMSHVLLSDDLVRKRRLLLALVGRYLPGAWPDAVRSALTRIGRFGPYGSYGAALSALKRSTGPEGGADEANESQRNQLNEIVSRAVAKRNRAIRLLQEKDHTGALDAAEEARGQLIEVYCRTRRSLPGEHRAFWCHDAFGVAGLTWDQAVATLARNGFTAILPNLLWGDVAYFPSQVLPVAPEIANRGDQLRLCLDACKKYGLHCHVWKVNWRFRGRGPSAFRERMARERRLQVRRDGTIEDQWLCPSHPANQELEIQAMVEVATRYPVHGVHFDYIRYPGSHTCFCPGCRKRFEKRVGRRIENWPASIQQDSRLDAQWHDFRRANITAVVAGVHQRIKRERPEVQISAAVFADLAVDRKSVAQDWGEWCRKGYLDFVCPMDYTPDRMVFQNRVQRQLAWAAGIPCYPGIGLSTWKEPGGIFTLIDQIEITRSLKTGGFTIFNYGPREATEIVPSLGLGLTRKQHPDTPRHTGPTSR